MDILDLLALIAPVYFIFSKYPFIESENNLGLDPGAYAVPPPAWFSFTKEKHGWNRSVFHPSEAKKSYRKCWEAVLPPKIFLLLLFLIIMFMLQGKATPNTYMLLKINVFQLLRWKNES